MTRTAKFKIGDWVRFTGGPDKGRTVTITEVVRNASGFYYEGFFCGRIVGASESNTERY